MTNEHREKLKIKAREVVADLEKFITENEIDKAQVLLIYFDESGHASAGFGCKGCAVEAVATYLFKHIGDKHNTEDENSIKH